MSGGAWNYQSEHIRELADQARPWNQEVAALLDAVAKAEHIVDWCESGDTGRVPVPCVVWSKEKGKWAPGMTHGAEAQLYDLWRDTFNEVYKHQM